MKKNLYLSPDPGAGGDPGSPTPPPAESTPPPAPPPAASTVQNGKSAREIELEQKLRDRETECAQLLDENHRLKGAPRKPAKSADEVWHYRPIKRSE